MCKLADRPEPGSSPAADSVGCRSIRPPSSIPRREIAETAEIGPYCVIGAEVEIGARTRLMAHVYVEGPTRIGEDNIFFPYSHAWAWRRRT